jgi:hypothetical protein
MIYGDPVFEGVPDPIQKRSGLFKGHRAGAATPPADLKTRVEEQREHAKAVGWQTGEEWALDELEKMVAVLPPPSDYKEDIFPVLKSIASFNVPEDPSMDARRDLVCAWACSGSVEDSDGENFEAAFARAAGPGDIGPGTLIYMAQQHGYELPSQQPPFEARPDIFAAFLSGAAKETLTETEQRVKAIFEGPAEAAEEDDFDFDALCNPPPGKPAEWFLNGWIERGCHTLFDGVGGTGKSTKGQDYVIQITATTGMPGFNLSYEEKREEQYRRRDAFAKAARWVVEDSGCSHSPSSLALPTDNFKLIDMFDPGNRKQRRMPLIIVQGGKIRLTPFGLKLLASIAERAPCILLVDGLMNAVECRDNSRNDDAIVRRLLHMIDDYCAEFDVTWISILHPSRAGEDRAGGGSYAPAWTTVPRGIHRFTRDDARGAISDTIAPGSNHQRIGDCRTYVLEDGAFRETGRTLLSPAEAALRLVEEMAKLGTPLRRDMTYRIEGESGSSSVLRLEPGSFYMVEFRARTNLPNHGSVDVLQRALAELEQGGQIEYHQVKGGRDKPTGWYPSGMLAYEI